MAEAQTNKNGGNRNEENIRKQQQQQGGRATGIARQGGQELARTSRLGRGSIGFADPFSMVRSLYDDLDRVFQRFGLGGSLFAPAGQRYEGGMMAQGTPGQWSPQMEVFRRDGALVVRADLPGMERDDVHVEVDDRSQQLVIRGERKQEREWDESGVLHSERSYGSFFRTLPLPDDVKGDACKASFKNGVLEITLPIDEKASRSRRIEIGEG